MDRRAELIEQMFKHTDFRGIRLSREQFAAFLSDWTIHALTCRGRIAGATAQRGAEIHVVYFGRPDASIRGHLRAHLLRMIETFGYADTLVEIGNEQSRRFCERLGFREVKTVGASKLMRCAEVTYARKK